MKRKVLIIFIFIITISLACLFYFKYKSVNAPFENFYITEKRINLKEEVNLPDFTFSINDVKKNINNNKETTYVISMNIKKNSHTGKNFFYNLYIVPYHSGINQTRGIRTKNMDQPISNLKPYVDYTGDVKFTLKTNKYTEKNIKLVFLQHEGKKYTKYYYTIVN